MVNAFEPGPIVAVIAGAVGWFMVLRRQTFAGHTLAVIAFPGAAGAALAGIARPRLLRRFAIVAALVSLPCPAGAGRGRQRGVGGDRHRAAFALGLGFLFVTLYGGQGEPRGAALRHLPRHHHGPGVRCSAVAVAVLLVLAAIGRPLLFASVDAAVARGRGVPTRLLATAFLLLLGLAVRPRRARSPARCSSSRCW